MAYTYHGTRNLVTAPGRSVQTFPSGLVRVERTYICRRGDEARYRSELAVGNLLPDDEGTPAIDGLYIYPDPQEQTKDSGFTEFRVTSYGRTNTTGNIERLGVIERLTGGFGTKHFDYLYENYIFTKVLPSNVSLSQIFEPPQINIVTEVQPSAGIASFTKYDGPINLGPSTFTRFIIDASAQGFVVSEQPFLSSGSSATTYSLYSVGKGIFYASHTTKNFGSFSEYAISYNQDVPRLFAEGSTNFLPRA
jgi:hypothetical protein